MNCKPLQLGLRRDRRKAREAILGGRYAQLLRNPLDMA